MDFTKKPLTPMRCVVAATGLNGDPDFFFNRDVTVRMLLEKARLALSQIFNLRPPDAVAAVGALAHAQAIAGTALVET